MIVNKRCDLRVLNVYDNDGLPLYQEIGSCERRDQQIDAKEAAHKKTVEEKRPVMEKAPKDRPNPGKPGKDKPRPETPVVQIDPDRPPIHVETEDEPTSTLNLGVIKLTGQVGVENSENSKKSMQAKSGGSTKFSRHNADGKQNSVNGSRQNTSGKSGRR